jgi:hypothetical protein
VSEFLNTCSKARNLRMPRFPDGAVHLDAEPAVDADLAPVVHPGYAEHHHALGLHHALEDLGVAVLRVTVEHGHQRLGDLHDGLVELRLDGILGLDVSQQRRDSFVHGLPPYG